MARKDVIPVRIDGGIEGGTHPFLQTRLSKMRNCRYALRGGVTKRFGTYGKDNSGSSATFNIWAATTAAMQTPTAIHKFRERSVIIGQNRIYARQYADTFLTDLACVSEATASFRNVNSTPSGAVFADSLEYAGNTYSVWRSDPDAAYNKGKIYLAVSVTATGESLLPALAIETTASMSNPRVLNVGSTIYVLYSDASGNIYCKTITITGTTVSLTSRVTLISSATSDANKGTPFDAVILAPDVIAIGYHDTSNKYTVKTFSSALSQQTNASLNETNTSLPACLSLMYDGTNLFFAFGYVTGGNTLNMKYGVYSSSGSVTRNTTAINTYTAATNNNNCALVSKSTGTAVVIIQTFNGAHAYKLTSGGTATNGASFAYGSYFLASRPWYNSTTDTVYSLVLHGDVSNQRSLSVVNWITETTFGLVLRPVASVIQRVLPTWPTYFCPPASVTTSGSTYRMVVHNVDPATTACDALGAITISMFGWRNLAEIGTTSVLAGGVPQCFDGSVVVDIGLNEVPGAPSLNVTGSGSLSAGVYRYILVREYVDALGNIHRGAPSAEVSGTSGGSGAIDVTANNLSLQNVTTGENSGTAYVRNVLYRTTVNGNVFYRLYAVDNATGAATYTYSDTASDSSIASNEQLYTMGSLDGDGRTVSSSGTLDNVAPPSSTFVTAHKNRFWLSGTPDDAIWYSKKIVTSEGPAFNDTLVVPAFEGGRVVATAQLGESLAVLKANSVWIIQGDGANDAGLASTLAEPQLLANDIGCVDARSVCTTPLGVFFQSKRGIYLLSNNGDLAFVGEDIQNIVDGTTTVVGALLVQSQSQVRFYLNGASSVCVVYDMVHKAWYEWNYLDVITSASTAANPVGACLDGGVARFICSTKNEYVEDTTTYLDNGSTWVTMAFETGWLHVGEIQGYQRVSRVQVLGEKHTSHSMSMLEYTDYKSVDNGVTQTRLSSAISSNRPEQFEFSVMAQRCQALKIYLSDAQNGTVGTGRGTTIASLALAANSLNKKWRPAASSAR